MHVRVWTAASAIGALGAAQAGPINYTDQERTAFALAGQGGTPVDTEIDESPGLGDWSGSASANYGFLNGSSPPQYTARGTGSASQMVTLADDRIIATYVRAGASGFGLAPANSEPLYGSGFSTLSVSFTLDEATAFALSGTTSVFEEGDGLAGWTIEIDLFSAIQTAYSSEITSVDTDGLGDFGASGELGAGSWTMRVLMTASAGAAGPGTERTAITAFTGFELVVPAPATGLAGVLALAWRRRREPA